MNQTTLIKIDLISSLKIFLLLIFLLFLYFIRDVLLILLIAFIISAFLNPLIGFFQKRKFSRVLAALLVYLFVFLIILSVILLVTPTVYRESIQLIKNFSIYYEKLQTFLRVNEIPFLPVSWENFLSQWQGSFDNIGRRIFSFLGDFLTVILSVIVIIAISFYLTIQRESWPNFFLFLMPKKYHHFVLKLIDSSEKSLSTWGNAQLFLCFFIGLLTYIGLEILGIQFALVLAVIAGITEVIPRLGPIIGSIPAILIAFLQSPVKALAVIILYTIIQQLENLVILPQVMKKAVGLNPIVVIVVLLIGAKLAGVLGMIIAVPVTAIVSIIIKEYQNLKKGQETEIGNNL